MLWLESSKSSESLPLEMDGEENHFVTSSNASHALTTLANVVHSLTQKLINMVKLLIFFNTLFPKKSFNIFSILGDYIDFSLSFDRISFISSMALLVNN
ncbi:hypothetical protein A7Q09_07005 [Methylacidiphilum sp. Yel]|nr:hypothetical protein A7Q09_07005 [Methylacidiphilum sp. Yel]